MDTSPHGLTSGAPRKSAGRRERKKLEVYARIRQAGLELFREKGYEGATVDAIAERADVAKGTVFNYFPRKEALLAAAGEYLLDQLHSELGPFEKWRGNGRERLRRLFLKMAELAERDRELSRFVLFENMRDLWLRSRVDPSMRALRSAIRSVLADGQQRRELRADVDVDLAARLMESSYFTTLVNWLSEGTPGRAFRRDLTEQLDIIFRGLSTGGSRERGCRE